MACVVCGKPLPLGKKLYCCWRCSTVKAKQTFEECNSPIGAPGVELSTGTVGTIQELRVCADLLRRGYPVFRAVSSHEVFDVLAIISGVPIKIEVTTGYHGRKSRLTHGKTKKNFHRFNVLAIVDSAGLIIYRPALNEVEAVALDMAKRMPIFPLLPV